jgi:hypothetical protein
MRDDAYVCFWLQSRYRIRGHYLHGESTSRNESSGEEALGTVAGMIREATSFAAGAVITDNRRVLLGNPWLTFSRPLFQDYYCIPFIISAIHIRFCNRQLCYFISTL